MTEQMKAATVRALYGAILTAALTFLVTLQGIERGMAGRMEDSALAAGVAFFGYMIARGMVEGLIDSNRGPTSADVGQPRR